LPRSGRRPRYQRNGHRIMSTTTKTLMMASAAAMLALTTPMGASYAAEHNSRAGNHSAASMKSPGHAGNRSQVRNKTHNRVGSTRRSHSGKARHAHRKPGHHFAQRGRHHRRAVRGGISIYAGGSACGYSYRRWQETGSRYWRSRYYDCIG
jgi:hypothetical protein